MSDARSVPSSEAATKPPLPVPETVSRLPAPLPSTGPAIPGPVVAPPDVPGYEILLELGRGGMGVVYKARHIHLNRIVALKMILGGGHASREDLTRFLAEAEAVAALQHPNIVQIFETGQHDGLPFFTLEFVDGGTLSARVREHPLTANEAAHVVEQLAQGVAYAHGKGIVHRDLKPENVLLNIIADSPAETEVSRDTWLPRQAGGYIPKITDFGLAKRVKGGSGMTHTGAVVGTPSYMAPEQAQGKKEVGPSADVYALGAILYRLVTGRPPFQAATPLDTVMQVVIDEPVPPRQLQPKLPKDLETICLKCLQKDTAKRYPSADALADDLVRFLNDEPIQARPIGPIERALKWAKRRPTVAGLIATLVLGTIAAVAALSFLYLVEVDAKKTAQQRGEYLAKANDEVREQRDQIKVANDAAEAKGRAAVRALEQIEVGNGLRLADEGDRSAALLWFAKPLRGDHGPVQMEEIHRLRFALFARHAPKATLVHILPHSELKAAAFSPDGRFILTAGGRTAQIWDVAAGRPITKEMMHESTLEYAAFGPEGQRVVTVATGGVIRVWDSVTGKPIGPSFKHPGEGSGTRAAISPEGARVVTSGEDQTARIWDSVTGSPVGKPISHDAPLERAVFSPDGKRIFTAGVDGTARIWDATSGRSISTMKHGPDGDGAVLSADGHYVLTSGWDLTAQVWDAGNGKRIGEPLPHNRFRGRPAFSPDSRRLWTVDRDGTIRIRDVRTGRTVGPALVHPPMLTQASFSPDGRTLLTVGQDRAVRVWDTATGGQKFTPLKYVEGATTLAAFSPDSRHVLIAANVGVMLWDLADARPMPVRLTSSEEFRDLVASADARVVAAIGNDNTVQFWDTLTGSLAGPPARISRKPVQLSPDGRRAAMFGTDNLLRVTDIATGQSVGPRWNAQDVIGSTIGPVGRALTVAKNGTATIANLDNDESVSVVLNLGEPATRCLFSPDGWYALVAGRSGIRIWDTTADTPAVVEIECAAEIRHLEFSPDGRFVLAAGPENAVWTWNSASGQPLGPAIRHSDRPERATISPDGKHILIAWMDGTARVFEIASGQPAGPTLAGHPNLGIAFSPDGRLVCLIDGDEARLWDAATGQPASPPFVAPGPIIAAPFQADGSVLRILARHHTAQDWDIRPDPRPAKDLLLWAQLHASRRLDVFGGLVPSTPDEQLNAFRELKTRLPAEFAVSTRTAMLWRLHEALACSRDGNWHGVNLHLRMLGREVR